MTPPPPVLGSHRRLRPWQARTLLDDLEELSGRERCARVNAAGLLLAGVVSVVVWVMVVVAAVWLLRAAGWSLWGAA